MNLTTFILYDLFIKCFYILLMKRAIYNKLNLMLFSLFEPVEGR